MEKFTIFFDKTNTKRQAFYDAWNIEDDQSGHRYLTLALLIEPSFFDFIIEQYRDEATTEQNLKQLIYDMGWIKNPNRTLFEETLKVKTGFQIDYLPYIDREAIRKKMATESFLLLFNGSRFEEETLKIFNKEQKNEFTNDELWEVRKGNNKHEEYEDWEDIYLDASINLLREFRPKVEKQTIELWFKKREEVEQYCISTIYEYISNKRIQDITKEQEEWIANWCNKTLEKFDFKTAITKDGTVLHFKLIAVWISFFMKKFNLIFPSHVMLDMLSFDYIEGNEWTGFDYLIERLDRKESTDRIIENLKGEILDDHVLKNHVSYISERKIVEAYPSVLREIANIKRDAHDRSNILDIYFKGTNDVVGIKKILPIIDSKLRWEIVKKLFDSDEKLYLTNYLLNILNENTNESINAAEYLVKLQNSDGVKHFVNWILQNTETLQPYRLNCLSSLKKVEWIPYLVQLLECSFQNKITLNGFDTFNSVVINTFHEIAMSSQEEFNGVTGALKIFMEQNIEKYENVNYLVHTIERIETQFYMNKSKTYSINQAVEKLRLIQN